MRVELVDKVGVDAQISDEWMVVGEGEDFLLSLLAEQPTKIFKSVGASFERLCTGVIDGACRVILNQAAQAHNGT
jgi:hypothetical protein